MRARLAPGACGDRHALDSAEWRPVPVGASLAARAWVGGLLACAALAGCTAATDSPAGAAIGSGADVAAADVRSDAGTQATADAAADGAIGVDAEPTADAGAAPDGGSLDTTPSDAGTSPPACPLEAPVAWVPECQAGGSPTAAAVEAAPTALAVAGDDAGAVLVWSTATAVRALRPGDPAPVVVTSAGGAVGNVNAARVPGGFALVWGEGSLPDDTAVVRFALLPDGESSASPPAVMATGFLVGDGIASGDFGLRLLGAQASEGTPPAAMMLRATVEGEMYDLHFIESADRFERIVIRGSGLLLQIVYAATGEDRALRYILQGAGTPGCKLPVQSEAALGPDGTLDAAALIGTSMVWVYTADRPCSGGASTYVAIRDGGSRTGGLTLRRLPVPLGAVAVAASRGEDEAVLATTDATGVVGVRVDRWAETVSSPARLSSVEASVIALAPAAEGRWWVGQGNATGVSLAPVCPTPLD